MEEEEGRLEPMFERVCLKIVNNSVVGVEGDGRIHHHSSFVIELQLDQEIVCAKRKPGASLGFICNSDELVLFQPASGCQASFEPAPCQARAGWRTASSTGVNGYYYPITLGWSAAEPLEKALITMSGSISHTQHIHLTMA